MKGDLKSTVAIWCFLGTNNRSASAFTLIEIQSFDPQSAKS